MALDMLMGDRQAGWAQGLDKTPRETQARGPAGSAEEPGRSQEQGRDWEASPEARGARAGARGCCTHQRAERQHVSA